MKAALSIGARVIPVDVARDRAKYIGSWEGLISGEARRLQVTAESYEDALQALRLGDRGSLRRADGPPGLASGGDAVVTDRRADKARREAEKRWPKTADQRSAELFKARDKERLADEEKTARLRALRLAKEAETRAAEAAVVKTGGRRKP